jgi:hypothetical protein
MAALETCEAILAEEAKRAEAELRIAELKSELEAEVGMDYDTFIAGMRKLMAPIEREAR